MNNLLWIKRASLHCMFSRSYVSVRISEAIQVLVFTVKISLNILLFENISQIFSTTNRIPGIFEFHCDWKTKMFSLHWWQKKNVHKRTLLVVVSSPSLASPPSFRRHNDLTLMNIALNSFLKFSLRKPYRMGLVQALSIPEMVNYI